MTNDLFNFRDYVLFLKDKLDNTELSQVVGVHGDYGAGKTTTMEILEELYKEDALGYDNILKFSAWRNYYNNEHTVWKALLYELAGKIIEVFEELDKKNVKFKINSIGLNSLNGDKILKQLKEDGFGKFKIKFNKDTNDFLNDILYDYVKLTCLEIQYNLYQDLNDFDGELKKGKSEIEKHPFIGIGKIGFKVIKETKDLTELFLSGGFSGIIGKIFSKNSDSKDEKSKEQSLLELFKKEEQDLKKIKIDSLEVIQRKFDILIELYNLISYSDKNKTPLIIMIDDLDRIIPEKSVEIIEILRIFFEKSSKIHFICAIDLRVIEKGIERKFNQLNKGGDLSRIEFEEYLEKIITIPFDLPSIPLIDFDYNNKIFGVDKLVNEKIQSNNYIKNKSNIIENIRNYNKMLSKIIDYISDTIIKNIENNYFNYEKLNENILLTEINKIKYQIELELKTRQGFNNILLLLKIKNTPLLNVFYKIYTLNYRNTYFIEEVGKIDFSKKGVIYLNVIKYFNEKKSIQIVNNHYIKNIQIINSDIFKNIIKIGLQANPRKIKRFMDVFEIYFKILMYRKYRQSSNQLKENQLIKYSVLLSKMLIIKLEWDEIYKEFIKDKHYLSFIEQISCSIGKGEDNNFSFKITKYIKNSKIFKISNLFGMLNIIDEDTSFDNIKSIYTIYYLFPIFEVEGFSSISKNENIDNIGNFNLQKYLYEEDDEKIKFYINKIKELSNNENIDNISSITNLINSYIRFSNEENNEKKYNII